MAARPSVVILAGPNGAGKSTASPLLLREMPLDMRVFINADEIAAERSPDDPAGAAIAAGREMLSRLHELALDGQSFTFETTLASRHFAPWLKGLVASGYSLDILFLWLPTPDLAVARVKGRVMVEAMMFQRRSCDAAIGADSAISCSLSAARHDVAGVR